MVDEPSQVSARFRPFGETIFAEFTELAKRHDAINLGQGFPDFDGPQFIMDAARDAMAKGRNQYARSIGEVELNERIAARFGMDTGQDVDPAGNVTVTSGCTEAIAATFLGLVNPGDEIILMEPFYDAYPVGVAMAGATARYLTLQAPDFRITEDALQALVTPQTRAVMLNTPHNPLGRVFGHDELEAVAAVCRRHDLLCFSDEVYERLVYDDARHTSIATLPGMWERTVTLSSLGKTFSLTGWKIGWAVAPEPLTAGVRAAHQFLTYATATPLQHGAAAALDAGPEYYRQLATDYRRKRDLLAEGLDSVGFEVYLPQGTYFIMCDHRGFGYPDDRSFARFLTSEIGVAAIPPSAFYSTPGGGEALIRFAFCKGDDTLRAAVDRLRKLRA